MDAQGTYPNNNRMKEVKANDYSIFIGQESLQAYDFNSYNQLAILVDENTKRDCLPYF